MITSPPPAPRRSWTLLFAAGILVAVVPWAAAQDPQLLPEPEALPADAGTPDAGAPTAEEGTGVASPERPEELKASYRIGPGDSFQVRLSAWLAEDVEARTVAVAPDGTISFLQADKIKASGLTIPQLRKAIEEKLAESHRDPRVIIQPVTLNSKGYVILGMVNGNGKYPLNRPVRLLEAIALSGGLRSGGGEGSTLEQAGTSITTDFRRSFLVRNNQKLAVDFEKLYLEGDMRHNVSIRDGDYIYMASNARHTVYALGFLAAQRAVPVRDGLTVMGVITESGGFAPYAWKGKVLLIRGSLDRPEVIAVDTGAILKGNAVDLPVEAGDIVYVHDRPWATAERLLDVAVSSFIRGAINGAIDEFAGFGAN